VTDGRRDIERAANDLAARLPESLAPLGRLAYNYRWSWHPDGPELYRSLDPVRWERCLQNPVHMLQEVSRETLWRASEDGSFCERASALEALVRDEVADSSDEPPVAFFCSEYGVHVSLPVYSGGLGALAGDLVKEASDSGLPLVAVGLMYHQGYFRQRIDASGWQHEYWVDSDPERLPAALVTGEDGAPLTVSVPIGEHEVRVQIWRVEVGRVSLYLLDTDRPDNDPFGRWISSRLYVGDPTVRFAQYVVLGVGGVRALSALGIEAGTLHLNEGHPALAPLELPGVRTVFTTHTPVPAGNDTYPADQVEKALSGFAEQVGRPAAELVRLGRTRPDDDGEPFGVTQFALHMSQAANGVSRRHGEVARGMWQELWPDVPVDEVPIGHVTNGVHLPTWLGGPMRELLTRRLGEGWLERAAEPATWAGVDEIPDQELWDARGTQRASLVEFAAERSVFDRYGRTDLVEYVDAAARTFSPDVLTIGFARRVATYKRLGLLAQDHDRLLSLLEGDRPVQVLLAGKAHPRDDEAKRVVQGLFGLKGADAVAAHVIFLDDYDLATAARLVQGCDLWVNLPRPPLEASGTSGMKSVMNGGLQLSVLDGWWAEGYDGTNGWALSGEIDDDHGAQDARDGAELYRLLEQEIVPAFYERDEHGLPAAWLTRVRASLRTLGPAFSASRMLAEYAERAYRSGAAAR
jgi:starch phosphorylase